MSNLEPVFSGMEANPFGYMLAFLFLEVIIPFSVIGGLWFLHKTLFKSCHTQQTKEKE